MYDLSEQIMIPPLPMTFADHDDGFDLEQWIYKNHQLLEEQIWSHGSMLIRGLNVDSPNRFQDFIESFPHTSFNKNNTLMSSLVNQLTQSVFTLDHLYDNCLHHTLAHTPYYPHWVFMACGLKPEAGGNTQVCKSDAVYQELLNTDPRLIHKSEEQGCYYQYRIPYASHAESGPGWPELLHLTEEHNLDTLEQLQSKAEHKLHTMGYKWQWHDSILEVITPVLPAIKRARGTQKVFFNQILAAAQQKLHPLPSKDCVFFGDGEPITAQHIRNIENACRKHTYTIQWDTGDLLILDNEMMMTTQTPSAGKHQLLMAYAREA